MKKTLIALLVAVVAGFPAGWIVAMTLTPVFWRLEPVLHMELAGRSGPSDWLIMVVMAIASCVIFFLLRWTLSSSRS
jgi:hypothetical protein